MPGTAEDLQQVALVNFELEPTRLLQVVQRDLHLCADMSRRSAVSSETLTSVSKGSKAPVLLSPVIIAPH